MNLYVMGPNAAHTPIAKKCVADVETVTMETLTSTANLLAPVVERAAVRMQTVLTTTVYVVMDTSGMAMTSVNLYAAREDVWTMLNV